jgi:hypothetical protein
VFSAQNKLAECNGNAPPRRGAGLPSFRVLLAREGEKDRLKSRFNFVFSNGDFR